MASDKEEFEKAVNELVQTTARLSSFKTNVPHDLFFNAKEEQREAYANVLELYDKKGNTDE
jgi:hypothetical protein